MAPVSRVSVRWYFLFKAAPCKRFGVCAIVCAVPLPRPLRRWGGKDKIRDKIVGGLHTLPTRLATLRSTAMLGPSHPNTNDLILSRSILGPGLLAVYAP